MAGFASLLSNASGKAMAFFGFGRSLYDAGGNDLPETADWNPRPAHAESRWANGSDALLGRSDDQARNNSWVSGFIHRDAERVIGPGLKPYPTPLYSAFNKDYAWGAKFGSALLTRYRQWAEDPLNRCDAGMRKSLGELEVMAYESFLRTGEVLFEIRQDFRGSTNPINILLIDPKRIDNPVGTAANDPKIRNGIEYADGIAVAAWIRPYHPDDNRMDKGMNDPVRVEFRTETGTPKLVLISNVEFIEQVRGVPPFAASMSTAKNLDSLEKDVANRTKLETQMGVMVKSPGKPEDVVEMTAPDGDASGDNAFMKFFDWREKNPLRALGSLFVRHLYPDEDVLFTPSQTPGPNYPPLRRSNLAKMAADMGGSLPEISQDHEGINLSNARSIENNRYRTVAQRRDFWVQRFRMPIHIRWMEWEVAMGNIKIPGGAAKFYTHMTAITNTTWFGPNRGTIDPVKEATGRNLERAGMRQSSIRFMLEDGLYPQETWDQIAYEVAELEARKLSLPDLNTKGQSPDDSEDSASGGTADDRDGDGKSNEDQKRDKKRPAA